MPPGAPLTLAGIAANEDARLFVGRRAELQRLADAAESPAAGTLAVYISGPAGIGKSALLRAFARWAEDRGIPTVLAGSEGFSEASPSGALLPWQGPVRADATRRAPLTCLLLIDDYDRMRAEESRIREELLGRIGGGVGVVLAGRTPARRLWADAPDWLATVTEMPLAALPPPEAEEFMRRLEVADPALCSIVAGMAAGQPRLLVRSAAAAAESDWLRGAALREPRLAQLFLLERLLHPGSRRRAWRAAGSDELIAAASLLPHFDRGCLIAALGRSTVERGWSSLLDLAGGVAAGRPAFPEALRERLQLAVRAQRPWAEGHWRQRFRDHLCRRAESPGPADDPEEDWRAFLAAACDRPWHAALHPLGEREEGWIVQRAPAGPGRYDWTWTIATADGRMHGEALSRTCREGGSSPGGAAVGTVAVEFRTLRGGAAPDAIGVLVRAAAGVLGACRRAIFFGPGLADWAAAAATLPALGFRPEGSPAGGWVLDMEPCGHAAWLRRISLPPADGLPDDPAAAAREALTAIGQPTRLEETAAMTCYRARHDGGGTARELRAWLLDALASCGLSPTQEAILTQYYVEGGGPHEALCDRLDVPRATYYRIHRLALQRLGEALFES
jgi:hypothetical protein